METNRVVLGLGSNLGDREGFINQAINLIETDILSSIKKSSIYINKALLKKNSPKSWNLEFLNLAISGYTKINPIDLLSRLKKIEKIIGRTNKPTWSPREIDIDILAYNEQIYIYDNLIIPHKELLNRDFAIVPFSEVWPDWVYPVNDSNFGKKILDFVQKFS